MTVAVAIDSLTTSQRLQFRQTPDEGFFTAFKAAYAEYESAAGVAAPPSGASTTERQLADLLGQVHTELSRRRGIGADAQAAYADILNRAYSEGGMVDPVGFLKSLSTEELAVVQRNHCLADRIAPASLSREGAYNLLLPEDYRVDFNHDDLIEVGAGRTMQFPPTDAPPEFVKGWLEATSGMGEMDALSYSLVMFSSMHTLGIDGEPMRRTLDPGSMASYRGVVDNYLDMLERLRGQLAEGQYERDKVFFSRLQALIG